MWVNQSESVQFLPSTWAVVLRVVMVFLIWPFTDRSYSNFLGGDNLTPDEVLLFCLWNVKFFWQCITGLLSAASVPSPQFARSPKGVVENTPKLYSGPTIQSRPCRLWPSLIKVWQRLQWLNIHQVLKLDFWAVLSFVMFVTCYAWQRQRAAPCSGKGGTTSLIPPSSSLSHSLTHSLLLYSSLPLSLLNN